MSLPEIIPTVATVVSLALQAFNPLPVDVPVERKALASHEMSLETRYANKMVNDVFKDNILLTISYLRGDVSDSKSVDWEKVTKPFRYELTLQPNENFAFHEDVLAEYQGKVTYSTKAHFNFADGFKTDGYLYGDGVCHLASLMYWVAKDAGLDAKAPVNHDFANIPEVPREYGVAIFNSPESPSVSMQQNLYITNNKDKPVTFVFDYENNILTITAEEKV